MNNQSRLSNQHATFISAQEACQMLGIKPATLYTYVSRGLVYRISIGAKSQSRYSLSDVLNLKARAEARAGHGPVAADALHWGQPVLSTSISTVGEQSGFAYREHSVAELIQEKAPIESVAELLWTGEYPKRWPQWDVCDGDLFDVLPSLPKHANPYDIAATVLPLLATRDADRHALTPNSERHRARSIIRYIAASVALPESIALAKKALKAKRLSHIIAHALGLSPRKAAAALEVILVLCAEHELNASTFAARVAASTKADLYACLSAAVGTHSGPRQGRALERVLALLDEVRQEGDASAVLQARFSRGDCVPGFGHKLYPHGDPRGQILMHRAKKIAGENRDVRLLFDLVKATKTSQYYPPNLDLGLAMMTMALGIPESKASSLFLIGRFAGWIAHILEQRGQRDLLRPRAEYTPWH